MIVTLLYFTVALSVVSNVQGRSVPAGAPEKRVEGVPPSDRGQDARDTTPHGVSTNDYFPPPESQGGWRKLDKPQDILRIAGMDPGKLDELGEWLLQSDKRNFAAVVIRRGYIVLEVERGNSAKTDSRRVASVSKAVCATVLAIASEQSRQGLTPKKMKFDDPAFAFIPWAQPLSDPRKAQITVKQLLNHTSGLCPEATGAKNDGTWEYVLGHTGDPLTAQLAFDPGTACGYSSHAFHHAALVCETVTGKPYDQFAIEALFKPLGIEHWWFQYFDGGEKIGRHPTHGLGMPARDLARIGYCMLRGGHWGDRQVIPNWFVEETAAPTHDVKTPEMRWKLNPQIFSHGWQLPARHSAEGIPADARDKPGSGGQYIAFVPSLELVIARQTGSSGEWAYEDYLRRACAAVAPVTAPEEAPHGVTTNEVPEWFPKAPPLPAPQGQVIRAATVDELFPAVERISPGGTILLADGHYRLPRVIVLQGKKGITIRSAGGDPDKVTLSGRGWDSNTKGDDILHIGRCEGVTIADLTFADCRSYGVKVEAENAPKDIHIYNCCFRDIGVRAIKGSAGQDPSIRAVRGSVRYCRFENTKVPPADWLFGGDYIAAIDMMALEDWTFSDNVFRNIQGRNGGGRAAIFIWVRSRQVVVERNLIVNCDRGVAFGNPGQSTANIGGEPLVYVSDGIIRNNFIAGGPDCGIELWYAEHIKVCNNSIWRPEQNWSRGIRIGTGTSDTDIANNLVHGEIRLEGGQARFAQNLAGRLDGYFVDPTSGNLMLTPAAVGAIDHGVSLSEVTDDIRRRSRTGRPDLGAWEFDHDDRTDK
jgi:CubicO group peptidase (beta-lactamase class C family)